MFSDALIEEKGGEGTRSVLVMARADTEVTSVSAEYTERILWVFIEDL